MSVQAGIWNFDGKPVDREVLAEIGRQTADYGPDDETIHINGNIGMLYRPFHSTAESRLEHQPLVLVNGNVITWDGRLDNRDEMVRQLGEPLNSLSTDVSIVAAAYEKWGCNCFVKLLGDWALSIWNSKQRELILARDYVGIKQLFYSLTSARIVWSSHLASLVIFGEQLSLCAEFIAGYLTSHPGAQLTPYSEIHSVEPGRSVYILAGTVKAKTYWSFDSDRELRYKTDAEYEEQYRDLFCQAVRRRLRADSPVLAELSGGYDSSSIVCMADEIMDQDGCACTRIDTFTFVDHEEPDEDDSIYASIVEKKRGRVGHRAGTGITGDAFLVDGGFGAVPGLGGRQEIRRVLPEIMKSRGYRVILSGLGGDEFNGQALDFRLLIENSLRRLRLLEAGRQLVSWSLETRIPAIRLLGQTLESLFGGQRTWKKVEPWINTEYLSRHRGRVKSDGPWWWRPGMRDGVRTVASYASVMTHRLPSIEERRYPFLDRSLVEFLMSIPLNQLLRPGDRRSLMRRALRGILPGDLLLRRTKAGAGRSLVLTVQKQWVMIEQNILKDMLAAAIGIIDQARFRDALTAMKYGTVPERVVTLIKAIGLEKWLRNAVAHRLVSVPRSVVPA